MEIIPSLLQGNAFKYSPSRGFVTSVDLGMQFSAFPSICTEIQTCM